MHRESDRALVRDAPGNVRVKNYDTETLVDTDEATS